MGKVMGSGSPMEREPASAKGREKERDLPALSRTQLG